MAYFTLTTSTLRRYGTDRQSELLALLNDDSVHEQINEIINEKMREGDYIPLNMSEFASRNQGDYPGRLRNSASVTKEGITWRTPYAHYVWAGNVYGPNIPIHPKGDKDTVIGFYSPKGKTKTPTGNAMTYSTPGSGPRWVDLAFSGSGRIINQAVTNFLKKECRARGLNT